MTHNTHNNSRRLLLTRYEVARIVGMRALQIETGQRPCLLERMPSCPRLCVDPVYLASLELAEGRLDVMVEREGVGTFHVREAVCPQELFILLDTHDGGKRGRGV